MWVLAEGELDHLKYSENCTTWLFSLRNRMRLENPTTENK